MTTIFHNDPGEDDYGAELALSQLRYVVSSRAQATVLAENYVGLPLERTADPQGPAGGLIGADTRTLFDPEVVDG